MGLFCVFMLLNKFCNRCFLTTDTCNDKKKAD